MQQAEVAAVGPALQDPFAPRFASARSGFINRRFVRGPVDYRAIFTKADGKWMLSALIAGD